MAMELGVPERKVRKYAEKHGLSSAAGSAAASKAKGFVRTLFDKSRAGDSKGRAVLTAILLFLAAFAVRFIYLSQIKTGPLFTPTDSTLDEFLYHNWALAVASGDIVGKGAFWGFPLYPYFLGGIYALFHGSFYAARVIQILIGSVNCALVFFVGRRVFNYASGAVGGILFAFYGSAIFHDCMLVSGALVIFLNCAVIIYALYYIGRPSAGRASVLGCLAGITALGSPVILLFLPFFILIFDRHLKRALVLIFFCLMMIAPVTARNYALEKDFVPITAHGGITFFSGNNPVADGTYKLPAYVGRDVKTVRANARAIAEGEEGRALKPSEVSAFWFGRALGFIKNNPGAYARLAVRKFLLFVNHYDNSDIFDMPVYARFGPLLKAPFILNYALISCLAFLGIGLTFFMRKKDALLLDVFTGAYVLSMVIYFVNGRYRLPVVPVMAVFAGLALNGLFRTAIRRQYAELAAMLAVLAVIFFAGTPVLVRTSAETAYNNLGALYQEQGEYSMAVAEYENAIKANPNFPIAYNNLGITYKRMGNAVRAEENYRKAISLDSRYVDAYYNLGLLYMDKGDFQGAAGMFRKALAVNPYYGKAAAKLAYCEGMADSGM